MKEKRDFVKELVLLGFSGLEKRERKQQIYTPHVTPWRIVLRHRLPSARRQNNTTCVCDTTHLGMTTVNNKITTNIPLKSKSFSKALFLSVVPIFAGPSRALIGGSPLFSFIRALVPAVMRLRTCGVPPVMTLFIPGGIWILLAAVATFIFWPLCKSLFPPLHPLRPSQRSLFLLTNWGRYTLIGLLPVAKTSWPMRRGESVLAMSAAPACLLWVAMVIFFFFRTGGMLVSCCPRGSAWCSFGFLLGVFDLRPRLCSRWLFCGARGNRNVNVIAIRILWWLFRPKQPPSWTAEIRYPIIQALYNLPCATSICLYLPEMLA